MYRIMSNKGLYFQWRSTAADWRGQWVSADLATIYPSRSAKQLNAVQTMFPELLLHWERA